MIKKIDANHMSDFVNIIIRDYIIDFGQLYVWSNTAFVEIEFSELSEECLNSDFEETLGKAIIALFDSGYFSQTYHVNHSCDGKFRVLLTYSNSVQIG